VDSRKALINSFAKINLFLDVVCKRDDEYHNIETILQTISLSDMIEIELTSGGVEISCDNPAIPTDENNLAYRAFLSLKDALNYEGGVKIGLKKNIPIGSGLGGGSSNAAATLAALNYLLHGGLSELQLHDIARDIGADVPFFISGGLAAAWQIGDRMKLLPPLPQSFLVLAIPGNVSVSTSAAYAMLSMPPCKGYMPEKFSDCSDRLRHCVKALDSSRPLSLNHALNAILYNSFEKPVFAHHLEMAELKALLMKAGAKGALMSGSGSAVFGIADSFEDANRIQEKVAKSGVYPCFVVHTIDCGSELQHLL
jgi:4-diphosphocytidyl-2-C-methyl-D-erythritol kinase